MSNLNISKNAMLSARDINEFYIDSSGAVFMLLLAHDNRKGTNLFTSSNASDYQGDGLYSRLYLLGDTSGMFLNNSKYEFIGYMPDDRPNDLYRWQQTSNPLTNTSISGFVNIYGMSTGLVKATSNTYLRTLSSWWGAVGCWTPYTTGGVTGIPGFGGTSAPYMCTGMMLLYARLNQSIARAFDKEISVRQIIEI